jgi:hypothetical protein
MILQNITPDFKIRTVQYFSDFQNSKQHMYIAWKWYVIKLIRTLWILTAAVPYDPISNLYL